MNSGDKLGPYEIVEPIGKGGMGEVYRAHDERLRRDVAIKVSAEQFTDRFTREARAIASLNHTNVCHLYDVGPNYLVMEYVEGADLKGPLDFDDALPIIQQLIDGIEAAHEKNIIHRDLKPANIKLTPDGVVKILDFGLAKAMEPADSQTADPTNSPTLTMGATQAGTILGTAAYMSPEQAKGKTADKRSDIWSFGVIVYEMLTGQRMFTGESAVEILGSVLNKEPDISAAPPRVQRLLRWCLERDRKKRLASISDARGLLEEPVPVAAELVEQAAQPAGVRSWLWPGVAAVLAVIAAVAGWGWSGAAQPEDRPMVRLNVDLGEDVDLKAVRAQNLAISPDGTRIAYFASVDGGPMQIYTRRLDQAEATPLPGTEGLQGEVRIFFSPDGQWIGFAQEGVIKKVSVLGGAPVSLGAPTNFVNVVGGDWRDGFIAYGGPPGLERLPDTGGEPTSLLPPTGPDLGLVFPDILPGGKAILFGVPTELGVNTADRANIDVFSLADEVRKTVVRGGLGQKYVPTGHLLYANRGTLFAVPFDSDALEIQGAAVPLLDDLGYNSATGEVAFSISRNGTLIYRNGGEDSQAAFGGTLSTVRWLNKSGRQQPLLATPERYSDLRLSPDAQRLSAIIVPSVNPRVVAYDLQRGGTVRLSAEDTFYSNPVWSPDGRYMVWRSLTGMSWARSDGSGRPATITRTVGQIPSSFHPDGDRIAFFTYGGSGGVFTLPVSEEGGQLTAGTAEPFLATPLAYANTSFSPDGRWVAYSSDESGRPEISVRAFPKPTTGEGAQFAVSNDGGSNPVWSRNGSEIYYQSGDQIMAAAYRVDGDQFIADRPQVWAELTGDLQGATFWDMGPDGRAVITVPEESTEGQDATAGRHTFVYIENFFDELRQRVPAEGN